MLIRENDLIRGSLDLFIKLTEKCLDLFKERERSKQKFFREVVEPLHSTFTQMADEHITIKGARLAFFNQKKN
jgi:hypothetical protein